MSKADLLAAALDEFLEVSPEAEAAAVVSADGLPMASALPPHVEEDRLAAMSAALLMLGERAAGGLGKGELDQIFVEGAHGHVVLMSAGEGAVLVAVTTPEAKVGLILFEMRRAAAQVADILGRRAQRGVAVPEADVVEVPRAEQTAEVAAVAREDYTADERVPLLSEEDFVEEPAAVVTETPSEPADLEESLASWPIASDEPAAEEREPSSWEPRPRSDTEPEVSSW